MADAENCRGECGGGLLVDITAREADSDQTNPSPGLKSRRFLFFFFFCDSPLWPTPVRPG